MEGKNARTIVKTQALANLSKLETEKNNKGWREGKIGLGRGFFAKQRREYKMLQSREEHFLNNQDGTINQSANTWEFMPKFVSLH